MINIVIQPKSFRSFRQTGNSNSYKTWGFFKQIGLIEFKKSANLKIWMTKQLTENAVELFL